MQYVKFEYDTEYFGGNYSGTGAIAFVPKTLVDAYGPHFAFEKTTSLPMNNIIHYDSESLFDENHKLIEEPELGGRVDTVNVVEVIDGIAQVHSFYDNPEGNQSAELLFTHLVEQQLSYLEDDELNTLLDAGYWEDDNGYSIQINHG